MTDGESLYIDYGGSWMKYSCASSEIISECPPLRLWVWAATCYRTLHLFSLSSWSQGRRRPLRHSHGSDEQHASADPPAAFHNLHRVPSWLPSWNCILRHYSVADGSIGAKFGNLMQDVTQITAMWSKSQREEEFQYGERLFFFQTGSSCTSAMD